MGRSTGYSYDAAGRQVTVTNPDGSTTRTGYDAAGEATSQTDELGHQMSTTYDNAGRRVSQTDALGNVTGYGYNADGNQSSMTDPLGRATSYTYDADNRQTQVTYPDGSASKTGYDALGRKTTSTDPANQATSYGYDTLGHLTSVTDPSGNVTAYTYDAVGNELTQKDALGRTTSYAYNLMNRRTSRTLPAGQSESYTYDAVGDMLTENNFNGQTITYTYDPETGRLTGKSGAGLSDTYSYDADGERTGMTDNSGSTSYTYDERGRVTQKSGPEGTLNYTYDSHGNLLGLQSGTSNGLNETFTYDVDNRLSTFTDGRIGGTTNYGYDQDSNLLTLAYPNNLSTAYTYDTLDRLTGMNTQNTQSNSVVAAYAYTLRADGLRTGVTDSGPATSGRTDNWQYDPLDRLTQEAVTGASTVNGTSAFTYDSSNRLSRASTIQGVSNFSEIYNANDQRADEGFDNNGDTTGTNGNAYTFDAEGKLTGATLVTPTAESLTLVYDGDGNLASKANGSVTTTYLVDTNNPSGYAQIVEAKTNGTLTDVFNYGSAGIISQGHIPTGTTAYFGKDGSNNTRYLTDSQTGNVTDTMDYTADGIQVSRTGNFPAVHQFQGEYLDPDLSLYDLRARWMNPQTGEFMTMDTYEGDQTDPQSLHKYAFVKWDGGVNKFDPSGNDPESGINYTSIFSWLDGLEGSTPATLTTSAGKGLQSRYSFLTADQQLITEVFLAEIGTIYPSNVQIAAMRAMYASLYNRLHNGHLAYFHASSPTYSGVIFANGSAVNGFVGGSIAGSIQTRINTDISDAFSGSGTITNFSEVTDAINIASTPDTSIRILDPFFLDGGSEGWRTEGAEMNDSELVPFTPSLAGESFYGVNFSALK